MTTTHLLALGKALVLALALLGAWLLGGGLYADWAFLHTARLQQEQAAAIQRLQQAQAPKPAPAPAPVPTP